MLRLLVARREWPAGPAVRWPVALGVVLLVYAVGWAYGVTTAVQVLVGAFHPPPVTTAALALTESVRFAAAGLAVIALAVGGARFAGVSVADLGLRRAVAERGTPHARSGLGQIGAGAAFLVGYLLLVAVAAATGSHGYVYASGRWALWPYLVRSALAGPTEELALVALPTVLFRRAGLSWPVVGVITVALRVPFHLYYGWATLGIVCWATIVWAWYARTGRLWGPIAVHSAIDLLATVIALGGQRRQDIALDLLVAATIAAVGLLILWAGRPGAGVRPWRSRAAGE